MILDSEVIRVTSPSPVLLASADGPVGHVPNRGESSERCREVRGKRDANKVMRLCGDLPHPADVFSFTAQEALLLQITEVSAAYAQAVLALRNFSQHGGLEYSLDTEMNVNTNPTREQTVRMIRGLSLSREEADALKRGDREGFAVRVTRDGTGQSIDIDLQSVRNESLRLTLLLQREGPSEYILREWQMR